jgi:hypothetical protein
MPVDGTRLRLGIEALGPRIMHAARPLVVEQMKADPFVPRGETGKLAQSLTADPAIRSAGTRSTMTVRAPVIQARTTDRGTRPHLILPRRPGGKLAFYWTHAGRFVVLPRVNHPGNAPMPWWNDVVTDAFRQALPIAARLAAPQ